MKRNIPLYILVSGILAAYLAAVLWQKTQLGNILSALNALVSAGILLYSFLQLGRSTLHFRRVFLLGCLACASWGIADVLWIIGAGEGATVPGEPLMLLLYALTNLFLLAAVLQGTILQRGKWNRVQLVTDLLVSLLMCCQFFWLVLFDKDVQVILAWIRADFTSIASITLDILIICALVFWRLSVRGGIIPRYMRFFIVSVLTYAMIDLGYYTLDMKGMYTPNSLIDVGYSVTLALLALSSLLYRRQEVVPPESKKISNMGIRRKTAYLLAFPVATAILHAVKVIRVEPAFGDYIHYVSFLTIYWVITKYVQLSTENERLLKIEKQHSMLLQQKIADQEERLLSLENVDPLTQLGNRKFFMEQLRQRLEAAGPEETVVVLGVNIDRLRIVNEAFGHDAGDKTLLAFTNRLTEWNTKEMVCARISGDEFGFILPDGETIEDAARYGDGIVGLCDDSFLIDGNYVKVTLSVGIAASDTDKRDTNSLMERMSWAIRQAKSRGYNTRQVYSDALPDDRKTILIEQMLKRSRAEKDFTLYFQPQFAVADGRLLGAEALIRWNCKGIGFVPPDVFIPLAEEIGMIGEIGQWVLCEAMKQAVRWNYSRTDSLKIGVNLSMDQLEDERFVASLRAAMKETGVQSKWLDIEITESKLLRDSPNVLAAFSAFSELGVTVSIDDFGAGYAALGNLSRFHFDRIKIDRSLVDGLTQSNYSSKRIISSIIEMAGALNMAVIAEGVETREQFEILRELGCGQVQGFMFGRPVPAAEFERSFLHTNNRF